MRFLGLDLRNYGPFANAPVLDLGGGDRGLHLIVGPNEAGKSSALRAIRALLFDYPKSTPNDHGRDPTTLRVGATIRGETGVEAAFLRRKRAPRFTALDDRTPLPADPLASVLDGLDGETFETLFSTDHLELVKGGQAILRGGGKLGEMLFAAGSGMAQLQNVQKALQDEMDGLFKSRNAKLPAINKGLDELKAAREEVRSVALPTAEWVEADTGLNRAVAARLAVSRRKHEAQAELDRWKSRLGALQVIPRRQEVVDRLAARTSTKVLRPGFAGAYRAESEAARTANRLLLDARDALLVAEASLEALGTPDPSLVEADAIQRLYSNLGRYAGARMDRPDLALKLAKVEGRARSIRAELPEAAAIPPSGLASVRDPIQTLAQDQAALLEKKRKAEADLAQFDPEGPDPLEPGALRWVASLEAAITRAAAPGELEARRLEAQAKLDAVEEQAATSLRGLSLWSGTLDDLEALGIPPDPTFDRFDAEGRAAADRTKAAEAEWLALETKRIELDREAKRARLAGPIPTEADLEAHRSRRDDLWHLIRTAWVDREPPPSDPSKMADDFESRTRDADALGDSLRREARRVAADAQREVDRQDLAGRMTLWAEACDRAEADRQAILQRWADLWRPLGIDPLPPREMKDWVRVDRKERVRCAKSVRDARAEVARIASEIDQLRGELGHALGQVGEPPVPLGESLAAALDRGRAVVARIGAGVRREAARGRLLEVQSLESAWLGRWRLAVEPVGLPPDASVAAANAVVAQLGEWSEAAREVRSLRDQLGELDATERRFADEAGALAGRLGLESAGDGATDWGPVASALVDRLDQARKIKTLRDTTLARIDEERTNKLRAQSALARANEALEALAVEAGVSTVDALPDAIGRSAAVESDLDDLRRFDEQLDAFAGSMSRAGLLEAVAGLDDATLSARIGEAADALSTLEAELNKLGEEVGGFRERLDAMNSRPGAFEAQQVVQGHVARLEGEVNRYARLKLASAVLRDAVERHRVKNQGPVVDRAGGLFARLTDGSFVGLQADLDDKDEPILRGVRGRAKPVGGDRDQDGDPNAPLLDVSAMSEGTADQLYLALRLASLSVHLDDHAPAPFVVDDILINFDDARARAALEVLADLSKRTQVLFFTHHDHLAEIARAGLPDDVLFVHRLIPKSVAVAEVPGESTSGELPAPKPRRKRSSPLSLADP